MNLSDSKAPPFLFSMEENFGGECRFLTVSELASMGAIFVEDGNHGEYRPLQHEFVSNGTPFVRPPDLVDGRIDLSKCDSINEEAFMRVRKGVGQGGDIILSHRATVGRLAITSHDDGVFVTNPGATVWRSLDYSLLNPKYLYFFMQCKGFTDQLMAEASNTTTFPYVSLTQQRNLIVAVPKRHIQKSIEEVLWPIDEKIELNRKQNRTLEAIAQALFKRWFIEFEFPDENGRPYQSSGGAMEPSELGEIPAGWEVKPLDQIAGYLNGLALQKYPPEGDEHLPVIKIREMKQGITANSDKASTKLDPKYIVDDGDVLFSWSGSLEVDIWCHGKGALNQHLFKVTSDEYPKWFYYLWTKRHLRAFQAVAADKATTMGHIQRRHLADALTLCPPEELMPRFTETFGPLIDRIITARVEARSLAKVRDALLPKLMSGELRVA